MIKSRPNFALIAPGGGDFIARPGSHVIMLRARFFIHNSGIRMVGTEC